MVYKWGSKGPQVQSCWWVTSHLVIFKILAFSDNTNMPFSVLFHVRYNETNYTEIFYKKLYPKTQIRKTQLPCVPKSRLHCDHHGEYVACYKHFRKSNVFFINVHRCCLSFILQQNCFCMYDRPWAHCMLFWWAFLPSFGWWSIMFTTYLKHI